MSSVSLSCFYYSQGSNLVLDVAESGLVTLWENGVAWYNRRAVFPSISSVSCRFRETGSILSSKWKSGSITGTGCLSR